MSYYKHTPNNAHFHPNPQLFLIHLFCLFACWIWSHVCIAPSHFAAEPRLYNCVGSDFLVDDEGHALYSAPHSPLPLYDSSPSAADEQRRTDGWGKGRLNYEHLGTGLLVHHRHKPSQAIDTTVPLLLFYLQVSPCFAKKCQHCKCLFTKRESEVQRAQCHIPVTLQHLTPLPHLGLACYPHGGDALVIHKPLLLQAHKKKTYHACRSSRPNNVFLETWKHWKF